MRSGRRLRTRHDETLRDGVQSPSVAQPDTGQRVESLHLMAEAGIDSACLGMPVSSETARRQVTRLAEELASSRLPIGATCAARTTVPDIQVVADIAQRAGVHLGVMAFVGSARSGCGHAAAMSTWMGGVGSIVKDLPDVTGDVAAGRRGLTIILGATVARRVASAGAVALGVLFLAGALAWAPVLIPAASLTTLGALALALVTLTDLSSHNPTSRRHPYRVFMATQFAAHVAAIGAAAARTLATLAG